MTWKAFFIVIIMIVIIIFIIVIIIIVVTTMMVLLSASQTQSHVLKLALLSAEMLGTRAYLLNTIHSETTATRSLKPKYHLEWAVKRRLICK